jgi:hypothetical protein
VFCLLTQSAASISCDLLMDSGVVDLFAPIYASAVIPVT